LSNIAYSK
jgi:hypothetical protein